MTQVLFAFKHPDGEPLVGATFTIRLQRAGFVFEEDGVVVPETYTHTTGIDGTALVELQPSSTPYLMVMVETGQDDDDECCSGAAGLRYKFYVPVSDVVVRAQDLLLAPVPNSEPWDEVALQMLTDAKIAAMDAAERAETAAARAEELAISFDEIELRIIVLVDRAETAATKAEGHETNSELARDSSEAFAIDALASVGLTQIDKLAAQAAAQEAQAAASAMAAQNLPTWALSQNFRLVDSVVRNDDDALVSANIEWPDGKAGTFTADVLSTEFPGAIDAWHATYAGPPAKLITQPSYTRNANGAVMTMPKITITNI